MAKLIDALGALGEERTSEILTAVAEWMNDDEAIATCVATLASHVASQGNRSQAAESGSMTATKLCGELTKFYAAHLAKTLGKKRFDGGMFSNFRYCTLEPRAKFLPLTFVLWLANEQDQETPRFEQETMVQRQLAIFNPIALVASHILERAHLPRLGAPTPDSPLLPAIRPDIEADEDLTYSEILNAERLIAEGFIKILGVEDVLPNEVAKDFFKGKEEKACFLVYRRSSVNQDTLLKGFLAIQRPRVDGGVGFSFTHFYQDTRQAFRKTRGFVLALNKAHYFVGGTSKDTPTEEFVPGSSAGTVMHCQALKCMAVNRSQDSGGGHVWGGLFLSNGKDFEAIAGRCVFVRAKHGDYQSANIEPIKTTDLEADLKAYATPELAKMRKGKFYETLAEGILRAVDNANEPANGFPSGPLTMLMPLT
ncbi:MAG: hypothetical protein AB7O98_09780 [Hyphomonadaceae bacterium]